MIKKYLGFSVLFGFIFLITLLPAQEPLPSEDTALMVSTSPSISEEKPSVTEESSFKPQPHIIKKIVPAPKNIGEYFTGEKLEYNIGFFPIIHAADAVISFKKDTSVKNGYIAELKAQTAGLLKLLLLFTYSRKDQNISHMILSDDGKRLISTKFEKISKQSGKKTKRSITEFDYDNKTVTWQTWKGNDTTGGGTRPIPENTYYDDPLCAFYNLRFGVYGDIEKGKSIDVKTVPTRNEAKLKMQIASEEETQQRIKSGTSGKSREYLVKVLTEKDLFESKDGQVELWLSKEFVPVEGVVKGVTIVGDVRGILRARSKIAGKNNS